MSFAELRREELLHWLRSGGCHQPTAQEVVDATAIYSGHGRYDRCFDDLKVLEKRGKVLRFDGRPAQWEAA